MQTIFRHLSEVEFRLSTQEATNQVFFIWLKVLFKENRFSCGSYKIEIVPAKISLNQI